MNKKYKDILKEYSNVPTFYLYIADSVKCVMQNKNIEVDDDVFEQLCERVYNLGITSHEVSFKTIKFKCCDISVEYWAEFILDILEQEGIEQTLNMNLKKLLEFF